MPTTDIFNREFAHGGSFRAEDVILTFKDEDDEEILDAGLLMIQQIQWRYNQEVARIFGIGSNRTVLAANRPVGDAVISYIIAEAAIADEFFEKFGDICNIGPALHVLSASGCGEGTTAELESVFHFPYITGVEGTIREGQFLIAENVSLAFIGLERNITSAS